MASIIYYPGYSQTQIKENLIIQTILTISQAYPMAVTTVDDHNYVAGMDVTFLISNQFGMTQLNGMNVQVLTASGSDLTLDIDSTTFTPFAYPNPLPSAYTNPSIIPNSSGRYLPPLPLPYGNQDSFEGAIYNGGLA